MSLTTRRKTWPRVPVHVEGLTALRARYAAAIVEVISQVDVVNKVRDAPSRDPRHVFDVPDGWRLIVSRERTLDGRVGIHLSASRHDVGAWLAHDQMLDQIVRTWRFIAESDRTPVYLGLSAGGIPHWFVEQES